MYPLYALLILAIIVFNDTFWINLELARVGDLVYSYR